jgi:hypothetical protein
MVGAFVGWRFATNCGFNLIKKAAVGVETNGGFDTHFTPEPLG